MDTFPFTSCGADDPLCGTATTSSLIVTSGGLNGLDEFFSLISFYCTRTVLYILWERAIVMALRVFFRRGKEEKNHKIKKTSRIEMGNKIASQPSFVGITV